MVVDVLAENNIDIEDEYNNEDDYNNNPLKLFKHLDRLHEWDAKGDTHPTLASIDLTNACNQKCPLCMGVRPDNNSIPFEKLKEIILQLKEAGVRAIGLGGGGDPSAYPKLAEALQFIKSHALESGVYSNCYMLADDTIDAIINCCTFLRISLDADGPETYKKTHGMNEKVFYAVIENIKKLITSRKKLNKPIVIGAGYLVGPHTIDGIYNAAKLYKELGLDYIRIRPFFYGTGVVYTGEHKKGITEQLTKSLELKDKSFEVSSPGFRMEGVLKGARQRPFKKCYIHHFETLITANQKLYPCCHLSGMERYCYGDLKEKSFKEVWNSENRKNAYGNIDFRDCPNPCTLDAHNKLLWDIKRPVPHSNFL